MPGSCWSSTARAIYVGWLAGGMTAWRTAARPLEAISQVTVHELRSRFDADEVTVLDVRQPAEWAAGHIPGAAFVTGADLPSRLDDVPDVAVVATVCGSGYRSSVASSLLAAHGRTVINVLGGMAAWNNAHYPTEKWKIDMDDAKTITMDLPVRRGCTPGEEAFKAQSFDTLSEIDVQAPIKEKLDVDIELYVTLGACNPS